MRILGAAAVGLVLVIGAFRLWPDREPPPQRFTEAPPPEVVTMEELPPTTQRAAPPPPPQPAPPIPGPDVVEPDELPDLDEPVAEFTPAPVPAPSAPAASPPPSAPAPPAFVAEAEQRPRVVRTVVPDYPAEAARRGVRARIVVRVLVDERGRVVEAAVAERRLVDRRGDETVVQELGFGVEEAALAAAREHQFRPGRHEGRAVRTYTTVTLRVGV